MDPWDRVGEEYRLPQIVLKNLGDQRCYKLADAKIQISDYIGRIKWREASEFQLEGEEVENWNEYVKLLERNCVILEDDIKDKLIWT